MPLSPSERIKLIQQVSDRLGSEDWSLIDLTLQQFSLPWSNEWQGTREEYVMQMISKAADEQLIELGEHVGIHVQKSNVSTLEPAFWQRGMLRVFLSHLSAHKTLAANLQGAFLNFGISCFVAHNDIKPTLEWQNQIETALATCDSLISLLHPHFHSSDWTDQEIGFAMGRGIPVFSIMFGAPPYGFIGRFQAFNGNEKSPYDLAREIFEAYTSHKQTQRQMAEIAIELFEKSNSYAEAKEKMTLLEKLPFWTPSFSKRLIAARDNNSQIRDAWFVSHRINTLLKKWAELKVAIET